MKKDSFKHIVVGVDLSVYSRVVVKEAQMLAAELDLPVKYVHVFDYFQTLGETIQEFEGHVRKKIIKSYGLSPGADIDLRLGDPAQQLIEAAKQAEQPPLIIVGYRGQSRISQFFLGSTAEKTATLSPYPVWIHRGRRTVVPKKVLIPSDFSERTDAILEHLEIFQRTFNSAVELFHVIPRPVPVLDYPAYTAIDKVLHDEDDRQFEAFKASHPHVKLVRKQGGIVDRIEKQSRKFNLIALSPREKSNIVPLLGRTATKVVRSSDKPILICP